MNKTLVTLVLIIIALGAGVVYLHIHNNKNDLPKPPLANEVSDVERVRDVVSDETPDEEVEVILEDGIALTDAGFVPGEIETNEEPVVIYNQTDATVLIAEQGVDCAASPAECDLVAPGESLELNRSEIITYTTNDGYSLTIGAEE